MNTLTTPQAAASTQSQRTALQLGFVGTGWIGRHRMQALQQAGHTVAAILEPDAAASADARALAPDASLVTDFDQLLGLPLDGVVIATPSALHAQQSIQALRAGLPVFCQKPLGRSADEVAQVLLAAHHANRRLGLDLSYRHTCARLLQPLIASGELGHIYAVEAVFHNAYGPGKPWFFDRALAGGGCLMDLGVHLVDLILWLLDFPHLAVRSATLLHQGQPLADRNRCEDYATALLQSEGGTSIQLTCSWNLPAGQEADIQLRLYGTQGGVALRNRNGSFYHFQALRFRGTQTEVLFDQPDEWGGRAAVAWAQEVLASPAYHTDASQYLASAQVLDTIADTARRKAIAPTTSLLSF